MIIKIGLKNNALFLFQAMNGDTKGGTTGGVYHNSIIHLTKQQFEKFKDLIKTFGYCPKKSLSVCSIEKGINFSCYLK